MYDVSRKIFVAQNGTRKDENSVVWLCLMYDYVIALGLLVKLLFGLGKAGLLLVRTLGLHRAIFESTFPLLVVSFW
jgi:hypothetical protein